MICPRARPAPFLVVLAALLPVVGAACGDPPLPTGIVAEVDSNLRAPDEIDALRLTVANGTGRVLRESSWSLVGGGSARRALALEPEAGYAGEVVLEASAEKRGLPVVATRLVVRFAPGRVVRARLLLDWACVGHSCAAGTTCQAGVCGSPVVDAQALLDHHLPPPPLPPRPETPLCGGARCAEGDRCMPVEGRDLCVCPDCPGVMPPSPAVMPSLAPALARVTPGDGERGVSKRANLVLTFDRPMQRAATEAALRVVADGAPVAGRVSWSDEDRQCLFAADRPFSAGALVSWTLADTAADATGARLASVRGGRFSVLRERTVTLTASAPFGSLRSDGQIDQDYLWVGDDEANGAGLWQRAFFTFDLEELAPDAHVTSATLQVFQINCPSPAAPYAKLGSALEVEPVRFERLSSETLVTPSLLPEQPPALFDEPHVREGWRVTQVLPAVREALEHRETRRHWLQFVLRFSRMASGDRVSDRCMFARPALTPGGNAQQPPRLILSYEYK